MKRLLVCVMLLVFVLPATVNAQHWTAEEQELITHMKKCWQVWGDAIRDKNLAVWEDYCQPTEDFTGWWTNEGALWTQEATKRFFNEFVKRIRIFTLENLQPLTIKKYGDVSIVYFYVMYTVEDRDGNATRYEEKRVDVFRKISGKWKYSDTMVVTKELGKFVEQEE